MICPLCCPLTDPCATQRVAAHNAGSCSAKKGGSYAAIAAMYATSSSEDSWGYSSSVAGSLTYAPRPYGTLLKPASEIAS